MNISKNLNEAQREALAKFQAFHSGFKNPNVLIMGLSGSGKTRSICNLPPKETRVIITEKSTLTFPNAKAFYKEGSVIDAKSYDEVKAAIFKHSQDAKVKYFVIDSFTGLWRMAYADAKSKNSGFAVWDAFAGLVQNILDLISEVKQIVFVLAHSEKINAGDSDDEYETEVVIEGKKIKKLPISSQFEACLFAKKVYETEDVVSYRFYTNALRHTPAKSPEGMLPRIMANDLKLVADAIEKFYK